MTNDIDSWETGSNSNKTYQTHHSNSQGNIAFANHHMQSGKIYENVTCYQAKSCGSNPEIRYINSAIYTESIDEEEEDNTMQVQSKNNHQHEENSNRQIIEASHGDSISLMNLSFKHSAAKDTTDYAGDQVTGQNTYRSYSPSFPNTMLLLQPSSARSAVSSGTIARVERRCKIGSVIEDINQHEAEQTENQKYTLDNCQVARISTTSLLSSSNYQKSNGSDLSRKLAHLEWVRKKHKAAQRKREEEERAAKKQQEEEEMMAQQKEEKARLEKENFLKWIERKKQQELERKAMLENELKLQKRLKEIEDKAAVAKTLYLRQWAHKKTEEEKVRHKEQRMRQKKINEEREKRLEESTKAYEKWRESSKNKPKPATQGLLPHQKAKPAYINPIPWQSIVVIDSDEEEHTLNEKKENTKQLKLNERKPIMAHQ